MTEQGYRNRIAAVEWHGRLWRLYGTPQDQCEAMMQFCTSVIEHDYYGYPRPATDDPEIERMQSYFDRVLFQPYRPGFDLVSFD